jgi:hypothetical protein
VQLDRQPICDQKQVNRFGTGSYQVKRPKALRKITRAEANVRNQLAKARLGGYTTRALVPANGASMAMGFQPRGFTVFPSKHQGFTALLHFVRQDYVFTAFVESNAGNRDRIAS